VHPDRLAGGSGHDEGLLQPLPAHDRGPGGSVPEAALRPPGPASAGGDHLHGHLHTLYQQRDPDDPGGRVADGQHVQVRGSRPDDGGDYICPGGQDQG
ncbi:hypothetical protein FKM82_030378, partial [Ascaphus truei]